MSEFYKRREIEVEWTGSFPNLCSGHWIIKIDGAQLIDKNDDVKGETDWRGNVRAFTYGHFMTANMGTSGTYNSWHFDENYSEVFEDYYERSELANWWSSTQGQSLLGLLKDNDYILNESELQDLYTKLSDADWRSGSCGGCI